MAPVERVTSGKVDATWTLDATAKSAQGLQLMDYEPTYVRKVPLMPTAPSTLAAQQIRTLLTHLAGVRDGIADDVHQARVSTRRLRELLPLVAGETGQSLKPVRQLVGEGGRALGVVRELDTLIAWCDRLMMLHPTGAAPLAACRVALRDERERAARRLVKQLDRLDFTTMKDHVPASRFRLWNDSRPWTSLLTERIHARATRLARALDHAGGVYFPNRLHRVRIHLKKLRYAVEIAEQTRLWTPAHLRRDAGRLQDMLGDIHDLQVLYERLKTASGDTGLRSMLRADILSRHDEYLLRRERVYAIAAAARRFANARGRSRKRMASGAAAALLIPASIALLGGRSEPVAPDHVHVA